MAIVRNLMVRAGADFSQLRNAMRTAQKDVQVFQTSVSRSMTMVGTALAAVGTAFTLAPLVQGAIKVEGAIAQINRVLGDSADEFIRWANNSAIAFNMSRGEALLFGRTFANSVSLIATDSEDNLNKTIKLLKTASIVASGYGESMEIVMDRIASGLRGETESIQNLGIQIEVNMLETTEAFKKYAGDKSWNQLDARTQGLIRYYGILEQAQKIYGDELEDTTGGRLQQFTASLKNLGDAIGAAFVPILHTVLPILTQFTSRLAESMQMVSLFMRALFGMKPNDATKSIEKVNDEIKNTGQDLENAAAAQKGFLAGFDEINAMPQVEKQGTGGGPEKDNPEDKEKQFIPPDTGGIEAATAKAKEMAAAFKQSFADMKASVQENFPFIAGILGSVTVGVLSFVAATNAGGLAMKSFSYVAGLVSRAFAFIETNLVAVRAGFAFLTGPIGLIITAITSLTAAFVYFYQTNDTYRNYVQTIFKDIITVVKSLWQNVFVPFGAFLKEVFMVPITILLSIFERLKPAISAVGTAVGYLFKNVMAPFGIWLSSKFVNVLTGAFETIGDVIKGITKSFKGLNTFLNGIFLEDNRKAWEGLKMIVSGIFDALVGLIKRPVNLIIDAFNSIIDMANSMVSLPEWMTGGKSMNLSIPKIPKLARGGIVDSPTMAMVGEAGSELIMPLENTSFVDKMASALGNAVLSAMQVSNNGTNRTGGDVVLKIDGNTIARALNPYLSKEAGRVGNSIISIT